MRFLTKKQKVLLALIDQFSRKKMSTKLGIEKGMFLLKEEESMSNSIKFYSFLPYKLGPYSYVSYRDISQLKSEGYINEDENALTDKGLKAISDVDLKIIDKVKRTADRFESDAHMKNYVYKKYPEYTIKSQLLEHEEKKKEHGIYTIGYEGEDIDSFLNSLIKNDIEMLIDIRNNPFSMNFSFTKNKLKYYLESSGIKYLHIPELGIKSELRQNLNTEQDYKNLFKEYEQTIIQEQHEKIDKIIELGKSHKIALMCFERSKDMCHRGVVSEYIEGKGIMVKHI